MKLLEDNLLLKIMLIDMIYISKDLAIKHDIIKDNILDKQLAVIRKYRDNFNHISDMQYKIGTEIEDEPIKKILYLAINELGSNLSLGAESHGISVSEYLSYFEQKLQSLDTELSSIKYINYKIGNKINFLNAKKVLEFEVQLIQLEHIMSGLDIDWTDVKKQDFRLKVNQKWIEYNQKQPNGKYLSLKDIFLRIQSKLSEKYTTDEINKIIEYIKLRNRLVHDEYKYNILFSQSNICDNFIIDDTLYIKFISDIRSSTKNLIPNLV